jgi:hypothetical protein
VSTTTGTKQHMPEPNGATTLSMRGVMVAATSASAIVTGKRATMSRPSPMPIDTKVEAVGEPRELH